MGQTRRGGSSPTPNQGRPISQSPQAAQVGFPLLPWWDFGVGKRSTDASIRIKWPGQHDASPCGRASERQSVTPDVPHVNPRSVTYLHVAPEKMLLGFYQHPLGWKGSQLCLCLSCLLTLNSTHSDSDAQERYDMELPSKLKGRRDFSFLCSTQHLTQSFAPNSHSRGLRKQLLTTFECFRTPPIQLYKALNVRRWYSDEFMPIKNSLGTSLAFQWLGLCASNASN